MTQSNRILSTYSFLYCILSFFSVCFYALNGDSKEISFEDKIKAINVEVVESYPESDLLKSATFNEIFCNPKKNIYEVLKLLSKDNINDWQKRIAALSMQNLPLEDYLIFITKLLNLRKKEKISKELFLMVTFPGHDWNTTIQENYNDVNVRKVLNEIKYSPAVGDDVKEYVDMMSYI